MILKASQRANAKELAIHLLKGDTNEHVTLHEIRGFVATDLKAALEEAHAISRGTKCRQFLFSLSLNPPELENVPIEYFENAIEDIERVLGLLNQPCIIVFHEKNGRRHCHVVWSRIDSHTMTAINMAHYKRKLNTIAKALYLKHGWALPRGFKQDTKASSTNYNLDQWQQAERLKDDPLKLKAFFQTCWNSSDSKKAFASALQEYGLYLAKGDRRGYVAVDYLGEVYSLSRWLGVKSKDLKAKLGDHTALPSADQAQDFAKSRMDTEMRQYLRERQARAKEQRAPLVQELRELVDYQREERQSLLNKHNKRWVQESKQRGSRFSRGAGGIWDIVTGKDSQTRTLNEQEVTQAQKRDQSEMHKMVCRHLSESRELHKSLKFYKAQQRQEEWHLKKHIAHYINTATKPHKASRSHNNIEERRIALETRIAMLSGDIASLQGSLGNALLSDDVKTRIRNLIEQTKEIFMFKHIEKQNIQRAQIETEKQLLEKQQKLFHTMQQHEYLKQQQEQQFIVLSGQCPTALMVFQYIRLSLMTHRLTK